MVFLARSDASERASQGSAQASPEAPPRRAKMPCGLPRGASPVADGKRISQPQVPVTLPTYDEVVGRESVTPATFGDYVFSQLRPDKLNVLTIHAEVEGIAVKDEFIKFIKNAKALGHEFCPLGAFVNNPDTIPAGMISAGTIPGREGWVSVQAEYDKRDSSADASE